MMSRFGKWLPATLALAGLALLGAPTGARATLMLEVTQADFDFLTNTYSTASTAIHSIVFVANSGPVAPGTTGDPDGDGDTDVIGSTVVTGSTHDLLLVSGTGIVQVGAFQVSGSHHTSTAPGVGSGGDANVTSGSSSVTYAGNPPPGGGPETQKVVVGDTGFTTPLSGTIQSTASGTMTNGSITLRTWDAGGNTQFGGSDGHPSTGVVADENSSFTNNTLSARSYAFNPGDPTDPIVPFSFSGPYAKTIEFDITLNANGSATLTARGNVISNVPNPIPEPGSTALAFTGLGTLAIGCWFRRRRQLV